MHDKVAVSQRAGTAALWSANHLFERDPGALSALALAGNTTLRVTLMAVNPYTVHPMQAAMAAATLDVCSRGASRCAWVTARRPTCAR